MASSTKVAQIVRVSTQGQGAEGRGGIPRQLESCRLTAERHALVVVESFVLIDVSGPLVAASPEWGRVRDLFESGAISGVLVDATDRLIRASDFDFQILQDLSRWRATVFAHDGVKRPGSPDDDLLLTILATLGGRERSEIARRSNEAREAHRRAGRWVSDPNRVPYGFRFWKQENRWEVIPEQMAEVRKVYELAAQGRSVNSISKEMGGGDAGWSYFAVQTRLASRLYIGILEFTEQASGEEIIQGTKKKRKIQRRPEGEIIRVPAPGLDQDDPPIPRDLWERVQEQLQSRTTTYNKTKKGKSWGEDGADPFPLRGLVFCAWCSQPMDLMGRSRGNAYLCRGSARKAKQGNTLPTCDATSIPTDLLHAEVYFGFIRKMGDEEFIRAAFARARKESEATEGDLRRVVADLEGQLAKVEGKQAKLLDLYLDGGIPKQTYETKAKTLEADLQNVKADLARARQQADAYLDPDLIDPLVRELGFHMLDLTIEYDEDALGAMLRDLRGRVMVEPVRGRRRPPKVTEVSIEVTPELIARARKRLGSRGGGSGGGSGHRQKVLTTPAYRVSFLAQ